MLFKIIYQLLTNYLTQDMYQLLTFLLFQDIYQLLPDLLSKGIYHTVNQLVIQGHILAVNQLVILGYISAVNKLPPSNWPAPASRLSYGQYTFSRYSQYKSNQGNLINMSNNFKGCIFFKWFGDKIKNWKSKGYCYYSF